MGPCHDWVKVTCAQRQTLPIAGFAITESSTASPYVTKQDIFQKVPRVLNWGVRPIAGT